MQEGWALASFPGRIFAFISPFRYKTLPENEARLGPYTLHARQARLGPYPAC